MCRERFDAPPIRGGFERPSLRNRSLHRWRTLFTFLPFTIAALFATCEARASSAANVHKLTSYGQTRRMHHEYPNSNYLKDDWQQANLYKGHSGDPWGSVFPQNGNVHKLGLPSLNSTYNDTRSVAFLSQERKTLPRTRFKRGVVHLYNMVVCATGCNPLAYKGYGCYCGFLGSGYVIDGIDRCCKMHDWCYDATECPMFSEYFVPYYWRCYHGYKPVCAVEHGNLGASGSCAQRLCECDRSLAECLRRYPCPTTKAVCTSSPWRLVQNLFMIM